MASNRDKALALLEAMVEADKERMAAVCREEFVWTLVPKSMKTEPLAGRAAISYLSTVVGANFKPGSVGFEVLHSVETDATVVFELHVTGIALNGRPYDNHYVMWFEFRDGLISEFREHTDSQYVRDVFSFGSLAQR